MVDNEENTVLHEALISRCKVKDVLVDVLSRADPGVAYFPNKEGKSPLYLAAQACYFHVVEAIGKSKVDDHVINSGGRQAKPALHGAILAKNKGTIIINYPSPSLLRLLCLFFGMVAGLDGAVPIPNFSYLSCLKN